MDIIELRKILHKHPDVSGCEMFAHDLIVDELRRLSPTALHDHVGGYGVVAYWQSPDPDAKCIAFRADIDALPTGHRCGHDGHTAILLQFARRLSCSDLRYSVLLIFQPEEETGKGAKKIVKSGLMQKYNVAAVFGLHNLPGFPEGRVVLNRHTFAAASCGVHYMLHGRSTHASTPELGVNPGLAVAEIINYFNTLNVASPANFKQSTLVCCRVGEEAFGTSAGDGEVMFTLRAFTNATMVELMEQADRFVIKCAASHGLELSKRMREPFGATENVPELVDQLCEIFKGSYDVELMSKPFRWSEDFAEYLKEFPGAFFGVGSGKNHVELHHPDYDFPDGIIDTAVGCFESILKSIKL